MSLTQLRKIAESIKVTDHMESLSFLKALYHEAKGQEKSYSYVRFSLDLGLGSANAHMIVSGKRPLTTKTGEKIADILKLTGVARRFFLALISYETAKDPVDRERAFLELRELKAKTLATELDRSQLEFFAEWYHAAIIELLRLNGASDDAAWIRAHLRHELPLAKIKNSLSLLVDLGYLAFNADVGRLAPTTTIITTGNQAYGMALMSFHRQMIDLAKDALSDINAEEREISAVTVAIPRAAKEEIQAEIIRLRKKILQMSAEAKDSDEIVQVNFQMFPLGGLNGGNDQ